MCFILFLFRPKIIISHSEILVHYIILRFSFKITHYNKKNIFTLQIVDSHGDSPIQLPERGNHLYQIKLSTINFDILLLYFNNTELAPIKEYVLKLEHYGIHLDKQVKGFFQLDQKGHYHYEQ